MSTTALLTQCIQEKFEAQSQRFPEKIAVIFGEQQLTYEHLNCRANQLAHYLRGFGVGAEVPVGICLDSPVEMIVGMLAILKAGGIYVPLDPVYPFERLNLMLEDLQPPVLLTQEHLVDELPSQTTQIVCIDSDSELIVQKSLENPVNQVNHDNIAYIIYTSGSTGKPKGVLIPHGAIAAHCAGVQNLYNLSEHDRVLQFYSFNFDASLELLLCSLSVGATLILRGTQVWTIAEFNRHLEDYGITIADLPTAYWQKLIQEWAHSSQSLPQHQLRIITFGGEAVLPEFVKLWQQLALPDVRLFNSYGPTETTITATSLEITPQWLETWSGEKISIGLPLPHRDIFLLDPQGYLVAPGEMGELCIGGACLAKGYLNRPQLTEEKFIPNPFSNQPGARMYKTGDLARYLPNGELEFGGRIDQQVKIRGFRIELGEIETALIQNPAVAQTVVMAREDAPGDKRLVAYVVCTADCTLTNQQMRDFLQQKLPEYMVPAAFVILDSLPLLPSGKVDRRALPEPELVKQDSAGNGVAPRDEWELKLAEIWQQVLGTPVDSIQDDFFELGGNSLLAVSLFAQIEQQFGKSLPLASLIQAPTIESLANLLRQEEEVTGSSLVPIQPQGSNPPFFCVHGEHGEVLCFRELARYLGSEQPFYAFRAQGESGEQAPRKRIEDMAAAYIAQMRTIQPQGPYFLGGYCFGGWVAFEMARQLQAQGEEIAFLALLESDFDDARKPLPLAQRLACHLSYGRTQGFNYLTQKVKQKLAKVTVKRKQKTGDSLPYDLVFYAATGRNLPDAVRESAPLEDLEAIHYANEKAFNDYVMHTYAGNAHVFISSEGSVRKFTQLTPYAGWEKWIQGEISVERIAGDHLNFLEEPYVQVLAAKLNIAIAQAVKKTAHPLISSAY